MKRMEGMTAVVFGGAGGIGTATSVRLAVEGANVVVGSLHQENADAVAAEIVGNGGRAVALQVDLASNDSIGAMVDEALTAFGCIDAAHINAADMSPQTIGNDTHVGSIDLDVFDRTMQVNLRGYVACTQQVLPYLLDRGGGPLVYTSSAAALIGDPDRPAYAISKAGIGALVRHVAARWGKNGIRANAVAPGPTISPAMDAILPDTYKEAMLATLHSPRLGRPDDIAAMVALLLSPEGEWVNGQVISVDGGRTLS
jgi:NAD(P)-dependent dehydrogenase (short-subunit alcohol dehydrogenase family)